MGSGFLLLDAESEHTLKELAIFLPPVETADALFDCVPRILMRKYESPLLRTAMDSRANECLCTLQQHFKELLPSRSWKALSVNFFRPEMILTQSSAGENS
jgi:hypothetical protein